MTDLHLDMPPPPSQRIRELHCWIAVYADGSQGILSADMAMDFGTRHTPLISSKREVAESLEPMARRAQRAAMHQSNRITHLRLLTYVLQEPPL